MQVFRSARLCPATVRREWESHPSSSFPFAKTRSEQYSCGQSENRNGGDEAEGSCRINGLGRGELRCEMRSMDHFAGVSILPAETNMKRASHGTFCLAGVRTLVLHPVTLPDLQSGCGIVAIKKM